MTDLIGEVGGSSPAPGLRSDRALLSASGHVTVALSAVNQGRH